MSAFLPLSRSVLSETCSLESVGHVGFDVQQPEKVVQHVLYVCPLVCTPSVFK